MTELIYTQTAVDPQDLLRSRGSAIDPLWYTRDSRAPSQAPATAHDGSACDVRAQQIAGSLQTMGFSGLPRRLPTSDPYRPFLEQQAFLLVAALAFDSGMKQGHRFQGPKMAGEGALPSAAVATPKIVAAFVGRVETLNGESANVVLMNEQTGERLESRCDVEVLRENGIGNGDEFRCEVLRSKGATSTRLSRVPPRPLSKERVEQIRARFKNRWHF